MANMPGKTEVDPEEEKRQQEQLEAMDQAEQERKKKWQKQENAREGMRAGIRDKVSSRAEKFSPSRPEFHFFYFKMANFCLKLTQIETQLMKI